MESLSNILDTLGDRNSGSKLSKSWFFVMKTRSNTHELLKRYALVDHMVSYLIFTTNEFPITVGFVTFKTNRSAHSVKTNHYPWEYGSEVWLKHTKILRADCAKFVAGNWHSKDGTFYRSLQLPHVWDYSSTRIVGNPEVRQLARLIKTIEDLDDNDLDDLERLLTYMREKKVSLRTLLRSFRTER